jgi:hypothetical protein
MWPMKWLTCGVTWTPVHLRHREFIRRRRPRTRLQSEPFITLNGECPIQQLNLIEIHRSWTGIFAKHFRLADWANLAIDRCWTFSVHKSPVISRANVRSNIRIVLRRSRWFFGKISMYVHIYNWISGAWQSELWNSSHLHLQVRNLCLIVSSLVKGFKV